MKPLNQRRDELDPEERRQELLARLFFTLRDMSEAELAFLTAVIELAALHKDMNGGSCDAIENFITGLNLQQR